MLRRVLWADDKERPSQEIEYELTWKKVKNINLRVKPDGRILVSAPAKTGLEQIDSFVKSRIPWILKAVSRLRNTAASQPYACRYEDGGIFYWLGKRLDIRFLPGEPSVQPEGDCLFIHMPSGSTPADAWICLRQWMEEQSRILFQERLMALYPLIAPYGVSFPLLKSRWMKSRWGSCAWQKGQITLNKALICAPMPCIDYVICHELTHFLHPDHGSGFYRQLSLFYPQHQKIRQEMRLMSPENWTPPNPPKG